MLANKSHLLHSITVNYTQLEPFIAHPLLTLPGLINPFTALCYDTSHTRGIGQRGCKNFRRRSGSVDTVENLCKSANASAGNNCALSSGKYKSVEICNRSIKI